MGRIIIRDRTSKVLMTISDSHKADLIRQIPSCLSICKRILSLLIILAVSIFLGCTGINRHLPMEPMSLYETEEALASMKDQEDRIYSFITSGTVSIEAWMSAREANILIFGTRDPFRLKIEVNHPWGGRLFHILIKDTTLEVLSFEERTLYTGIFTPKSLSRFLPGLNLDRDLVWSVARGYPIILEHSRSASLDEDQISILNYDGTPIEVINLLEGSKLPREVLFPSHDIILDFNAYKNINGIYYAQEVKVDGASGDKDLVLHYDKMVFNTTVISTRDFIMSRPPDFGTVYLD